MKPEFVRLGFTLYSVHILQVNHVKCMYQWNYKILKMCTVFARRYKAILYCYNEFLRKFNPIKSFYPPKNALNIE